MFSGIEKLYRDVDYIPPQIKIYENEQLVVYIPSVPLAPGALDLVFKPKKKYESDALVYEKSYEILQNLSQFWMDAQENTHENTHGNTHGQNPLAAGYFVLERREKKESSIETTRQIIPYPSNWSFLRRCQVLWNLNFPGFSYTSQTVLGTKDYLIDALRQKTVNSENKNIEQIDELFNPLQLSKLQVFEGKFVRVLINPKPNYSIDLLIAPIKPLRTCKELDPDTFEEAIRFGYSFIDEYMKGEYSVAYLNHANGQASGQQYSRWCLNLACVKDRKEEVKSSYKELGKLFGIYRKSLTDIEIAEQVGKVRKDLTMCRLSWGAKVRTLPEAPIPSTEPEQPSTPQKFIERAKSLYASTDLSKFVHFARSLPVTLPVNTVLAITGSPDEVTKVEKKD